ncbi:MAG: hypothetical protein HQM16_11145 [Deltaproteobacteria bacterium]|nr:hypothetical protein [Deltaproteobacteria bacterium]
MKSPACPIYVDFDDCLSQTANALMGVLKQEFNKTIPYESIVSFDLEKSFGITKEQWDHLMALAHDANTLLTMPVIEGAVKGMNSLHQAGFAIHIVTGRPPSSREQSKEWLDKNHIPYNQIYFVDKYLRFPKDQSADFWTLNELTQQKYAFAVEDSGMMAEYIAVNMRTPVYLLDRPWNRKINASTTDGLITRCSGWEMLVERVMRG